MSTTWSSGDPRRHHGNRARAESFGCIASEYDLVRPSYPPALIDDLVRLAPRDALDVGCGTGRAARLLIDRSVPVLGVEPDYKMAEIAQRHGVAVEVASFEEWDDRGRRFDLLVSGQAWHWIDPAAGVPKAARVLRSGGRIALFWNVSTLDGPVRKALDAAYLAQAPALLTEKVRSADPPYAEDLRACGDFADIEQRDYPWRYDYPRDTWLRLIQTHSDHVILPAEQRERLLAAVADAIDRSGGTVATSYLTHTILARRI